MKHFIIPSLLVFGLINMSCGKTKKEAQVNATTEQSAQETKQPEQVDQDKQQKDVAIITTDFGDMVVEFFEGVAPKHVESFKLHAQNGYYNGTLFHRVIPGFMIQGGDPNTKTDNKASYGTGGHAAKYFGVGNESEPTTWNVPAEFNDINHSRGILSMARANDPNSGGSQFFICAADAPHLNGKYTVFGQLIKGDQVLEQIVNLPRDARDNPTRRVEMSVRLDKIDN